jgi:hypothetical protein
MASRAIEGGAQAPLSLTDLATLLAAIPSLPRPILARLTARMIDRMDEMDPDPELEDTEGSGPDVDERGNPLPGIVALPGKCEDDEHNGDAEREEDAWPTIGAQWEVQSAA